MPLNSYLMKGAWVVQKNVTISLILFLAVIGGYYQFSYKPAQEEASKALYIENLLDPTKFNSAALSELISKTAAPEDMKLLVLAAIAEANRNPAAIPLAVGQVRMLLSVEISPK